MSPVAACTALEASGGTDGCPGGGWKGTSGAFSISYYHDYHYCYHHY